MATIVVNGFYRFLLIAMMSATAVANASPSRCLHDQSLCNALATIKPGEKLQVVVAGIYGIGPESRVLYALGCAENVQPVTWVEFAPEATGREMLRTAMTSGEDVHVVFMGTLHGPRRAAAPKEVTDVGRLQLMRSAQRYGHLGGFRTQIVVTEVVRVGAVPDGCDTAEVPFWAPPASSKWPQLARSDLPTYPELARVLDIDGNVNLRLTVSEGTVTDVIVETGHPVLADEAVRVVKKWQFAPFASASTVQTSFSFVLERRHVNESQGTRLELDLPSCVRVLAAVATW